MSPTAAPRRIAILGGGPCGLYAARVLTQAGQQVTVIDQGDRPGGLATSHQRGKNWYDLGCHMLHKFDAEIFADIYQLMGAESIPVELNAKIRWAGAFYRYPLQPKDMLRGIPFFTLCYYLIGLFGAQLRNKISPRTPKDAEEALIMLYGSPLYRFFFRDFTHRYWGMHPRELSATFITTKMPRLSAVDVFKKWLAKLGIKSQNVHAVESALSEETLHYSRTGAEAMPRTLATAITAAGGTIIQGATVTRLTRDEASGAIRQITYRRADQTEETIDCDACLSTIPLPALVRAMHPAAPPDVITAAAELRYKPIAIYGLLVKKNQCFDSLYIYYRDRAFHRVGEPKNAGLVVDPPDHTVLIVETTCEIGDAKWTGSPAFLDQIFADLEKENLCTRADVVETHLLHSETGYPVFALGFEPHLDLIKKWIAQSSNLQSTGRQGGFTYPNMHTAMRMGATAAQHILKMQPK
jgi:protoporphyrinogen oxidase